ncbi:MAG: hypothetical protein U1F27_13355 [Turneriella sp.]
MLRTGPSARGNLVGTIDLPVAHRAANVAVRQNIVGDALAQSFIEDKVLALNFDGRLSRFTACA